MPGALTPSSFVTSTRSARACEPLGALVASVALDWIDVVVDELDLLELLHAPSAITSVITIGRPPRTGKVLEARTGREANRSRRETFGGNPTRPAIVGLATWAAFDCVD